ncbi:MAG: FG-GAP-like repeat-containing protein [Bacteroidota bacterium]
MYFRFTVILLSLSSIFISIADTNGQTSQFNEVSNGMNINYLYEPTDFGAGMSLYDFNGDGWDDLSFGSINGDSLYFYENNNGIFTPVSFSGLDLETSTQASLYWVDYDNDGDKDLFVANINSGNKLYQNDGNFNFTDVTFNAGFSPVAINTYAVCWGDYNRDGHIDAYVLNRSFTNIFFNPNQLYKNNGDGTFSNVAAAAGVVDIQGPGLGAVFLDYNNDSWPDLYVANDLCHSENRLFKNNKDGTFSDVSNPLSTGLIVDGMGLAVGDYDLNGFQDIYNASTGDNCPLLGNILLKNNGNETFSDVAQSLGVSVLRRSWGINFIDIENDGDEDLFVSNSGETLGNAKNFLFRNNADGTFIRDSLDAIALPFNNSFGTAQGDWNNDGYCDIGVMNVENVSSSDMTLWQNLGGTNNWIKFSLEGLISNKDAIGVWINIWTNGQKQIRYTKSGDSYASQHSNSYIFGIGDAVGVDSVTLIWPSGIVNKYFDLEINVNHNLVEDTINTSLCFGLGLFDADGDGICDGDDDCPALPNYLIGTPCNDGDACTINDIWLSDCNCIGSFHDSDSDGVCDANDDCPDLPNSLIGESCDDDNPCTVNDIWIADCSCVGTFLDSDLDGICDEDDQCPDFDDNLIGTSCNDNDDCTTNDIWTSDCTCVGSFLDIDADGICDLIDPCPELDNSMILSPCDDGDPCTINEQWGFDCQCEGEYQDSDDDGICDFYDSCPNFDDQLIGTTCDDGDSCTINDVWTTNCNCAGEFQDADDDGTCDSLDNCPNDPNKTEPGICGCGEPDSDANNDGLIDCLENPLACESYNFEHAPSGLWVNQTNGNTTQLLWEHYSDAAVGCIIQGGTISILDISAPFSQSPGNVLIQGNNLNGLPDGFDHSAMLQPAAQFALFNPNSFPNGPAGSLIPSAFYKWRVRCGCIIDPSLPLPQRLSNGNIHLSPWSEYELFTNLASSSIQSNEATKTKWNEEEFTVFPNPFADEVLIRFKKEIPKEIHLVNSIGQFILVTIESNQQESRIETSGLASGIYVLRVIYADKILSKTILKN